VGPARETLEQAMAFVLTSPAFANGGAIPVRFTGDDMNLSPPLSWDGAPAETRSYVLVVEDPDAPVGIFGHWGIANLTATALEEGVGIADTGDQARNGFGHLRYDGPAPPRKHGAHHYHFRLAALSTPRLETRTISVAELWQLAAEHRIAETELIGTYERS
jgi:Raf kinase inhibitor-like YbhB/YbcL family protein